MDYTILANGSFPTHPTPLGILQSTDAIVCCDGAWNNIEGSPYREKTMAVVGDGDSILHPEGAPFVHVAEQETNDLTKALRYLNAHCQLDGATLNILGATGLREDHTLANISLLMHYAENYPATRFRMYTNHGVFVPVIGGAKLASHKGQQVSIISLTPTEPVTVWGLRYPIEQRPLLAWWEGTLNEALADTFDIRGGELIVFQQYK